MYEGVVHLTSKFLHTLITP